MRFSERLAQLRTEFDMTQKELAKMLGVSRGTIGMYEIGQRDPDTETIIKLTRIFGVTADYLMGISDVRNPYINMNDGQVIHRSDETIPKDEYFSINELCRFIKEQRNKQRKK